MGLAAVDGSTVEAVTPEELVQNASDREGVPVFLVGKVARVDGDAREVRLFGRDRTYTVVVRPSDAVIPNQERGELVVAKVFVAAKGVARFIGSRASVDTAYVLGASTPTCSTAIAGRSNGC